MKPIDVALRDKVELAQEYHVPVSSVVWIGNNHYIIVKNGREIKV